MPWDTSRPGTDAKYRTAEHRNLRTKYAKQIQAGDYIECLAIKCVFPSRQIVDTNGNHDAGLNLGHNDDGVTYRGPEHRACNLLDAATRASARSHGRPEPHRWVL